MIGGFPRWALMLDLNFISQYIKSMKVTCNISTQKQPEPPQLVNIQVELTKKQLATLRHALMWNVTVPDAIRKCQNIPTPEKEILAQFFRDLADAI